MITILLNISFDSLIILIILLSIYLTFTFKFLTFKKFFNTFTFLFENGDNGEISPLKSFFTSLAGSIGVGNIVGISTAILLGGVGCIFWIIIFSMFTSIFKFLEAYLSIKYRDYSSNEFKGGPMYYISKGLNSKFKFLSIIYSLTLLVTSLGIGNMVQSNAISNAFVNIDKYYIGLLLMFIVFLSIYKGIKRISNLTSKIIPFIGLIYIITSLFLVIVKIDTIPIYIGLIIKDAFKTKSIAGVSLFYVIKLGFTTQLFSNEAGMGTSGITHAASKTDNPFKQGLIASLDNFFDTTVICFITALVILMYSPIFFLNGKMYVPNYINEANLIFYSYKGMFKNVINISIILFGFSSIITWYYYAEVCFLYLFKRKYLIIYKIIYSMFSFIGTVLVTSFIWNFSTLLNVLLLVPNLIAIFLLFPNIKECILEENMV